VISKEEEEEEDEVGRGFTSIYESIGFGVNPSLWLPYTSPSLGLSAARTGC